MKSYKPKQNKDVKKFNSTYNKKETRQERGYNKFWYAYRARFLKHNPNCYACGTNEKIHLDHYIAHKNDRKLFWDMYNYIPLCHSCHSIVTGMFDRHDPPKSKEKSEWLAKQREIMSVDVKVKPVAFKRENLE